MSAITAAGSIGRWLTVFVWALTCALMVARWTGRAQQAGAAADDPRFTGKSESLDAGTLGVTRRRFDAGARSAWHSHARGQLLFVEEGRARVQRRGERVREVGRGESDYTAADILHWHGAVPGQALVQVAVSFGGDTTWKQKVTDAEYNSPQR